MPLLAQITNFPVIVKSDMPIFSIPILIGGAVAAGLAVYQYQPKRGDTVRGQNLRRGTVWLATFAPGVILSQVSWGAIKLYYPSLTKIEGLELLIGAVVGGVGLRFLLALYERIPAIALNRLIGIVTATQGAGVTPGAAVNVVPQEKPTE